VMRTTPASREFTDEPVPDDVLYRILEHARSAPSGGNRQGWRTVVVRDRDTRRQLLIAVGKPVREIERLRRCDVEEFATVDRFDGPAFTSG